VLKCVKNVHFYSVEIHTERVNQCPLNASMSYASWNGHTVQWCSNVYIIFL